MFMKIFCKCPNINIYLFFVICIIKNLIWTTLKLIFSKINSIQDYLYSAFYDTIVAKQLYRKSSFYNRFIYCRNLIYLTYDNLVNSVYCLRGCHHLFSGVRSSRII